MRFLTTATNTATTAQATQATQTTTFSDIFKSNFLDTVTEFSALDTFIALTLALVIGLLVMQVYKKTYKGVMYSGSFANSLMFLTVITTLTISAVTSNVVLSLGMVGALSIVRFRSAIKEPMDIAYLFWAISEGIVLGAGLIPLAVFGALFISIVMVLFINKESLQNPYILMLTCADETAEKEAMALVGKSAKKYYVKSKSMISDRGIELSIEVLLNKQDTSFVNTFNTMENISQVVLVSYNGDYMA